MADSTFDFLNTGLLTAPEGFLLRPIKPADVPQILDLIEKLAEYERAPEAVRATEQSLHEHLFCEHPHVFGYVVEVVTDSATAAPKLAGMALWFLNFSTWESTHGIYLEDLYVREEYRGRGLGKLLLQQLAKRCVDQGYQRYEWVVLKWNKPSIDFYKSFGAYPMDEWDTYRLDGEALQKFGAAGGEAD